MAGHTSSATMSMSVGSPTGSGLPSAAASDMNFSRSNDSIWEGGEGVGGLGITMRLGVGLLHLLPRV